MLINLFISLFGCLLIGLMQQYIVKVYECVVGLLLFFCVVIVEDWVQVEQVQQDMV